MSQNAIIFLLITGLIVLFAVGSMQRAAEARRAEAQFAVEVDAGDAGLQVLERADALPFDARAGAQSPAELTPLPFAGGGTLRGARDLDDLHAMHPLELPAADGTAFRLEARVEYVDAEDQPARRQTPRKRVTVLVSHPRLDAPVELARTYEMTAR